VPKRVRLGHDERRALILEAARPLLSGRPYNEVSMTDIAEAAGVARGLVHHYFGSKRELYLEIVREVMSVPFLPTPEDSPDLRATEIWARSVDRWIELIDANRELWASALSAGGIGHDAEVQCLLDAGREAVAVNALRAVGVDEPTPTMLALVRGYGGFTEALVREWLLNERLTKEQVRVLLLESLPVLVRDVFPKVVSLPSRRPLRTG
jgi:AcrR family transcriptional regulator